MNELDKFADIFRRRLEGTKQAQLRFVTCKSVDWGDKTMTAIGVSDDVPYEDVQLGFGYVDVKPKPDTVCLIGILEGKEVLTFLVNAEDVELVEIKSGTIKINDGKNGAVKLKDLQDNLEKLKEYTEFLANLIFTVFAPIDSSLLSGALNIAKTTTWETKKTAFTFKNMEDTKILHS